MCRACHLLSYSLLGEQMSEVCQRPWLWHRSAIFIESVNVTVQSNRLLNELHCILSYIQGSLIYNTKDTTQPTLQPTCKTDCSTEALFPKKRCLVFFREWSGDLFYFLFTCFPLGIWCWLHVMFWWFHHLGSISENPSSMSARQKTLYPVMRIVEANLSSASVQNHWQHWQFTMSLFATLKIW